MGTPMMRMGGLNFSLASGVHPFQLSRQFRHLQKQAAGNAEMLAESMQDPSNRTTILSECETRKTHPMMNIVAGDGVQHFVWPWSTNYEPTKDDSFGAVAKREGTSVLEVSYDVLSHPEAAHAGTIWRALYSYGSHDMEPLKEMLLHPQVVPGFGDGGAHGKMLCDATTPTTMLTHWCRDRVRGEHLPIELVVRKQTSDTAAMLGFSDRGELRVGKKADINIIDFDELTVLAPKFVNDLPLGAGRWVQGVKGYKMTMCSGVVTFDNDHATGELPGRIAKNPKATGSCGGLRGSVPHGDCMGFASAADLKAHALHLQSEAQGFSAIQKTLNATSVSSKL